MTAPVHTITGLETDKSELGRTRLVSSPLAPPGQGEALLRIDRVAVTANNITYAAFGDVPSLRYWSFFPGSDPAWGRMPAWGFADVVSSTVEGLAEGERFYGFWPIASHLVVRPVRVSDRGFYDGAPHRLELTSAYNHYQRTRTDEAYRPADEGHQSLLRPLFITSFMLADFLADQRFFGAAQLVVSSASSKTAYGTAFCLEGSPGITAVGVTSERNRKFVEGLGCYARCVSYEQIAALDPAISTLYVDFSGDAALRLRVHQHFGSALVYDCYAGSAQSHEHLGASPTALPGPQPRPYFAPIQIKKRNADWGPAEVTRRFNEAQLAFIRRVRDDAWMRVQEHAGFEAARALIAAVVAGRIDPQDGHVVRLP
jgi:hypothetical protein